MNTFLARANTIFAFTLTVLAALTFGCFLSTAFNDHTLGVVIDSSTALVYVTSIQMFHRRLATGNVQCVCSATYQIF